MYYFQTLVKNDMAVGMGLYSNFKYMEEGGTITSVRINDSILSPCVWSIVYNVNKKITASDKVFIAMLEKHCAYLAK